MLFNVQMSNIEAFRQIEAPVCFENYKLATLQIRLYESFVSQVKAWKEGKNKKY